MDSLEKRVREYWTKRALDFSTVRKIELQDEISNRWMEVITKHLPGKGKLKVLDVGTGTGYFAILLAEQGHEVYGIDLTPAMIEEANKIAEERELFIHFSVMDAQKLDFEEESFDVVIARNLTWTLPNPDKAYREWMRVLVNGGILLNFDADYGQEVLSMEENKATNTVNTSGFHIGLTEELQLESNHITKAMDISRNKRPEWDISVIKQIGYYNCECDTKVGDYILKESNGVTAPTFLIKVQK